MSETIRPIPLSPELARANPEEYKRQVFRLAAEKAIYTTRVWRRLHQEGLISSSGSRFQVDPNHWHSRISGTGAIELGAASLPQDLRECFLFDDRTVSYEDEIVLRFGHELSHAFNAFAANSGRYSHFNTLFTTMYHARIDHPERGFSSYGTWRRASGPYVQAKEDITELMGMYVFQPEYFRRYTRLLASPVAGNIRTQNGLVTLSENGANNLYRTIESVVQSELLRGNS